mmetsp:Transcript_32839/g.85262  ORF Transcript_32839/g.85262 Transcript_32839/m.85262 type:complete len:211 (+) Transcript_32839:988-1620(+)
MQFVVDRRRGEGLPRPAILQVDAHKLTNERLALGLADSPGANETLRPQIRRHVLVRPQPEKQPRIRAHPHPRLRLRRQVEIIVDLLERAPRPHRHQRPVPLYLLLVPADLLPQEADLLAHALGGGADLPDQGGRGAPELELLESRQFLGDTHGQANILRFQDNLSRLRAGWRHAEQECNLRPLSFNEAEEFGLAGLGQISFENQFEIRDF